MINKNHISIIKVFIYNTILHYFIFRSIIFEDFCDLSSIGLNLTFEHLTFLCTCKNKYIHVRNNHCASFKIRLYLFNIFLSLSPQIR